MRNATIKAEELANISSYQTLWEDKNLKSYEAITKLKIKVGAYLRLINLKRRVFDLAGTKNSSWTDRPQKSGRFEIKRF